jgi:hypothetical protein
MSSNVAPGQPVPIQANFFKMGMKGGSKIYMYKLTWGAEVDPNDST